jgi:hypothetical protein
MLMSGSVNRPNHVWNKTKHLLCDGILYRERLKANNRGIFFLQISYETHHVYDLIHVCLHTYIFINSINSLNYAELQLCKQDIYDLTLCEIEKRLQANRRTLKDFKPIPYPKSYAISKLGNQLIQDELNYDKQALHKEFIHLYSSLTGNIFI